MDLQGWWANYISPVLSAVLTKWPDIVVTALGVLFGVPPALFVGRALARRQMARELEAEEQRDAEFLLGHLDRVKVEIRDNQQVVEHLIPLLDQARPANSVARLQLFRWAEKRGAALSTSAYEDLARSGLQRKLPLDLQRELFAARQDAANLRYMLAAGPNALEFYIGFNKPQDADRLIENAWTYSCTVRDSLAHSKEEAYSHADRMRQRSEPGRSR